MVIKMKRRPLVKRRDSNLLDTEKMDGYSKPQQLGGNQVFNNKENDGDSNHSGLSSTNKDERNVKIDLSTNVESSSNDISGCNLDVVSVGDGGNVNARNNYKKEYFGDHSAYSNFKRGYNTYYPSHKFNRNNQNRSYNKRYHYGDRFNHKASSAYGGNSADKGSVEERDMLVYKPVNNFNRDELMMEMSKHYEKLSIKLNDQREKFDAEQGYCYKFMDKDDDYYGDSKSRKMVITNTTDLFGGWKPGNMGSSNYGNLGKGINVQDMGKENDLNETNNSNSNSNKTKGKGNKWYRTKFGPVPSEGIDILVELNKKKK